MLSTAPIRAYIPASNIERARKFYEQVVGLEPAEVYAGGVVYICGGAEVFLYPTPNAGTSKASQAFWQVKDVEAEVADLKARGVVFEEIQHARPQDEAQHRHRRRRQSRLVQGQRGQHHGGGAARALLRAIPDFTG